VAYRHALALACVTFGLIAVGCGDGGSAASRAPDAADDLGSHSSDQPAPNPDQPPGNPDQPPRSSDEPAGGPGPVTDPNSAAVAKCRDFCDGVGSETDCPGGGANAIARALCQTRCVVTAEIEPCLDKAASLIDCLANLDGLCTEDGPSQAQAMSCNAAAVQLNDCTDGGGDSTPGMCTPANQCAGCADQCAACKCAGASDAVCDLLC